MKQKLKQIAQNPKTKEAVKSMKPEKTVWGFLGIVLFFILPEIIAFMYGTEFTAYAKEALGHNPAWFEKYYFDFLVMMFEEGGSWVNLAIAVALLVWLFF